MILTHMISSLSEVCAAWNFLLLSLNTNWLAHSGGPGGCALASRLSEIPDFSVLLVESGGLYVHMASEVSLTIAHGGLIRNDNIVPMQVPLLASQLSPNTQWDWNFTITTQVHL